MSMEEARGFKGDIGKDKELNRGRKKAARTAKEKRRKKLDKLSQDDKSWKGLESRDIRTPSSWIQTSDEEERINSIKSNLDSLQSRLQFLKQQKATTPASKTLLHGEIRRTEQQMEKRCRLLHANQIVEEVSSGNDEEAVLQIKEHLDFHIHKRLEPYLAIAGEEIEEQIFGE